jgi:hypothetical protein
VRGCLTFLDPQLGGKSSCAALQPPVDPCTHSPKPSESDALRRTGTCHRINSHDQSRPSPAGPRLAVWALYDDDAAGNSGNLFED